ncbi:MAG: PSD1 and planctomycete cytochrome C domain-containing protein [Planctomycetota bacterium]
MPLLPRNELFAALLLTSLAIAQHEGVTPAPQVPPGAVDYARSVRPILAHYCYDCHGPDEKKRKAELRLDRREDAFAVRDGVAAFVAGDPAASMALRHVLSEDPEERMPPPKTGKTLKPAEIETLRAWITAGAAWSEHWAFVPPLRPTPPTVREASWPKNDVDRFVLARLEQEGLRPSAEAERTAWLRRVTFDLIGVPPTPAELDAFVADRSADAHEKVVDRLLADPRYGERMASDWLDLARYADSSGYQRDTPRQAWKWRDWVIEALNANMPFDQFTIEQLAGDLLPNPTLSQRIATGFNRNHPVNTEAGEELDEYRSAYVIDRVHTTATTWLGLSVGCAQCHDHKYDPISQREFYGFYDFFNHVKEKDNGFGRNPKPAIPAPGPDDEPRLADLQRRIDTLKKRLERSDPLTDEAQREWEAATRARIGAPLAWTPLVPTERMAKHGSRLQPLDDGSILATGPVPARDTYELVFAPGKRTIHALRIEVLPDPSLPHGASGRADDGRFILARIEAHFASVADSTDPPAIVFALAQADVVQRSDEDEHYLTAIEPGAFAGAAGVVEERDDDGDEESFKFGFGGGWSVAGDERKEPREALLVPSEPLVCNDTSLLRLSLTMGTPAKFKSLIGRFRISVCEESRVRTLLLPVQTSTWQALGPFVGKDVDSALATAFAPEQDFATAQWKKKYDAPELPKEEPKPAEPEGKDGKGKPDGKPEAGAKPAAAPAKPAEVAEAAPPKAEAEPEDEPAENAPSAADGEAKLPPKKKRLAWQEHRDWRDGRSASLPVDGPASAWYVARKVQCETARTVTLEFDGGAAAKVWLNGKVVAEYEAAIEPTAEAMAAKAKLQKEAKKAAAEDEDEMAGRFDGDEREPRRLRLGLRAGDNHVVLKLVGKGAKAAGPRDAGPGAKFAMGMPIEDADEAGFAEAKAMSMGRRGGGGLTFQCRVRAEGEDLLDYATMQALRATPRVASSSSLAAPSPAPTGVPTAMAAAASGDAAVAVPAVVLPDADEQKPKTTADRRLVAVRRWYRTRIDVAGAVLFDELVRLRREKRRIEAKLPSALVMEELKTPRETHLFVRGDYRKKGERVTAGTPAVLPPMAADLPRNRLGLARWLVSPDHPLTARVAVNRAWQQLFGQGLVRTPDDFGIRGATPSHPELLDWLATEFVRSGWNQKQLHRLLVLSATYRQSSVQAPELLAKDPENVLLARGPAQRLSAEMVRDQALAASGLLVQKVGGPSVKPFQPPGLWQAVLGTGDWRPSTGEALHRRGLYTYWKRGVPYPSATVFDAAKRETCAVSRPRTTTPLQALVTLNDPVYVEAGRALGLRMHKEGGKDDDARLAFGFRLVTSRAPDADELAILRRLLAEQRAHYADKVDQAKLLLGIAEPKGKGRAAGGKAGGKPAGGAAGEPAAADAAGKAEMAKPVAKGGEAADADESPKKPKPKSKPVTERDPTEPSPDTGKASSADEPQSGEAPVAVDPKQAKASQAKPADAPADDSTADEVRAPGGKPTTKPPNETAKPNSAKANGADTGKLDPAKAPAEAAAWAQLGCTLLNLEAAIRRG